MAWIIVQKEDHDYAWSNTYGWVTEDFDTFSDAERQSCNLPIDGEWVEVPWGAE